MKNTIQRGEAIAHSAAVLLARLEDAAGAILTQAATSTITVKIFDKSTGANTATLTPSVSAVITDTLVVDARWTIDNIGHNFVLIVPGSAFPTGGTTYRIEVAITSVGGSSFLVLWELDATPIYSS